MKYPHVIGMCLAAMVLTAAAETRVDIVGMRDRRPDQMLDLMGGRLAHVRTSPPSPPLADDAAFILRRLLYENGYVDAQVTWKIIGSNTIQLVVREGIRLSLSEVIVNGVPVGEEKKFAKLFSRPALKKRDSFDQNPPFREEDVEAGLTYIVRELQARGHWSAEAKLLSRSTSPTGSVDLTIEVRQGPLFRIGHPAVTSSVPEIARAAVAEANRFIGLQATTGNVNGMRVAVTESFTGSGYPDARVLMMRTLRDGKFIPEFVIEPGERVRLERLVIEGLERTSQSRVSSLFHGMVGDWYDEAEMNKKMRDLLGTGAFSSVRVDRLPSGEGTVDATLHFDETKAREIRLGAGVGSYQGFITRAGYTDRNLFGRLLGFNAGLELSFLGLLGEVSVTNPWIYGSDISGTARIYALIYGREGYTSFESGLEGKLHRKFGDHYMFDLLAGYSVVNLTEDGLPLSEIGENNYAHPRLRLTQTLDYRDNPVLPKAGWHLESPLQIGAAIGDDTTSYFMGGLKGGWYHSLGRKYQLGAGGEFGALIPSGDSDQLPIDLRLFNGGARSVRSFPERELGPEVDGYPTGGEVMWNANVELIRNITDTVRAVAFVDAGSLARSIDEIGSAEIELATGLGIRFDLPIGPVRFEYGFNLTRDPGEPTGTFHFAIGTAY
jgi:outer membrane protein insertion porin family